MHEQKKVAETVGNDSITAPSDVLVTADDGCAQLRIGRTTWYALIRAGELPQPLRIGSASRWLQSDLDAYIERLAGAREVAA